jgi:hypothetical protein
MADLKIRVFKGVSERPATTVSIPGTILRVASSLMPQKATAALKEQGIDLERLLRMSEEGKPAGELVTIDNHDKHEKITISLE